MLASQVSRRFQFLASSHTLFNGLSLEAERSTDAKLCGCRRKFTAVQVCCDVEIQNRLRIMRHTARRKRLLLRFLFQLEHEFFHRLFVTTFNTREVDFGHALFKLDLSLHPGPQQFNSCHGDIDPS